MRGSVKIALAVQHLAYYATLCSIAQHPCVLQYNATTGITHIPSIVLEAIGGQLSISLLGQLWYNLVVNRNLGVNNL